MQTSGEQTPTNRRPSPPRRVSTRRRISGLENASLENGVDGTSPAHSSPDDRDGAIPKPILNTDMPNRSKEEEILSPITATTDLIKRKSSRLNKKAKEAPVENRRSSSVSRDPKFGECANDAIGIRKDAKDARDLSNSNIAAASQAAFEETMIKRKK